MKQFFLFTLVFVGPFLLSAQQNDTIILPTLQIVGQNLRSNNLGGRTEFIDSVLWNTFATSVSDQLRLGHSVFLKTYGLGSLATSTVRGGSASHTLVTWNGFPISSPMLGQLDFSLLPSAFIDEVSVNLGGNSANWGSGGVSGAVILKNTQPVNRPELIKVQTTIGSFGWQEQRLQANIQKGAFHFSSRFFIQSAENDYPFRITPNLPRQRQTNFSLNQQGWLQGINWSIHPNHHLQLYFWLQDVYREIPPQTTQTRSLALQEDKILRATLNWKHVLPKSIVEFRSGFFKESILYLDELTLINSPSNFNTLFQEAEHKFSIGSNLHFNMGVNTRFTSANSDGYSSTQNEFRGSIFGSFKYHQNRLQLQGNLRQTIIDQQFSPFLPSIGARYSVTKWLELHGRISKNYHFPTLNDRFWSPGGNPDLSPENGWSQELTHIFKWKQYGSTSNLSVTFYNRNIKNWIRWSPQAEDQFLPWSPKNINQVWSRGIESRFQWRSNLFGYPIEMNLNYDLTHSTSQNSIPSLNLIKGEQLDYIPIHQALIRCKIEIGSTQVIYQQQYTGEITTIVEPLSDYQVGTLSVLQQFKIKPFIGTAFLRLENLWNTQYRVVERRVMPGRHYRLGFNLSLPKKVSPTNPSSNMRAELSRT